MTAEKLIQNNNAAQDSAAGRRVLETEIAGLKALSEALDGEFSQAVEAIDQMKNAGGNGRLIIAGIGKSGHVARKLAATFASTGTPSYFVHPGEASHGDLGMVTENDIVLMLSNSGENAELSDLIHYTRRFGITLIAMTSNAGSTLAGHADIVLLLPKAPEACPNGLAPTTSTTMMMALGDAIAVTLLERMGLTEEQFKVFHPGGKLGQRLQKVADIMHKFEDLPLVAQNAKMSEAIIMLSEKNLGAVLIIDDSKGLCGIITDGDLKRHMSGDLMEKPVTDIMSTGPRSISQDALAVEAMNIMTKTPGRYITSLIVTDQNGKLAGMIRLQDCLQAGIA
ncbi:MAG: KpsF/GutQ family sugar-phosphate isomerase [Rhodospirillales bacterium]|nr:KpsF/GutQ family sugar-phosphate isomerase [Rhodospirillales bacterium]MCB9996119.1 KpsF/GutQ family sugar-phosphate isomerase [Rhodospirillales bacterium]